MKRFTALLLALLMTIGLFPTTQVNAAELDYPVIALDVETMAEITVSNGFAYFQFTPETTHPYNFRSTYEGIGDDPQGYLYDSEMNQLAFNDDNGLSYSDRNFSITYTMDAGTTYVLGARYYNQYRIGSYPVILTMEHEVEGDVTKEPTCTEDGEMTYTCKHCDHSYTEVIPAAHKYENGFCIYCGEEYVITGVCGDALTWTLNSAGKLSITGTGAMYDYHPYYTPVPWTEYAEQIVAVEIAEGATTIGDYAFSGLAGLTEVTVPASVTSINDSAFRNCTALANVTLSEGLTTIEGFAFFGCAALTAISLPDTVTTMGSSVFNGCSSLASVDLGEGLTSMGALVFHSCTALTSIVLPDSLTTMGTDCFHGCSALAEVQLSAGLTEIPDASFAGTSLTEVVFPAGILRIGTAAFQDCTKLASIELPENLTVIDASAFQNCALTEVKVPESVVTFNDHAFAYNADLTEINIPEGMVYMLEGIFEGCSSLEQIVIPSTVTYIMGDIFTDCTSLKVIVFAGSAPDTMFDFAVNVVADVYYPGADETWTEEKMLNYGGTLTWKPMCPEGKHTFTDWETIVAATCTEGGEHSRFCRSCGLPEKEDVEPLGHEHSDAVVTPPTCTEQGYTTYTCIRCEDSFVDDYVDPTGHSFGEWVVTTAPTCSEAGEESRYCANCGVTETRVAEATGHAYETVVTAPTCTEQGYTTYTCACGDSYVSDYTDALGHSTELRDAREATCTEEGYTGDLVCTVCGETVEQGEVIPANCPSEAFSDLDTGKWYHEYTDYVLDTGLMKGMSETEFEPNRNLTRAMMVTTLYRMAGEPAVEADHSFADVAADEWYAVAVAWAAANDIVFGITETEFAPNQAITREQAATILYRYVTEYLEVEAEESADLSAYKDKARISGYAKAAVAWATAEGIFEGFPDGSFQPKGNLTRVQMAKLLAVLDQNF